MLLHFIRHQSHQRAVDKTTTAWDQHEIKGPAARLALYLVREKMPGYGLKATCVLVELPLLSMTLIDHV